jgi:hypothetical protein
MQILDTNTSLQRLVKKDINDITNLDEYSENLKNCSLFSNDNE